jgi:hypothetical protein
MGFVVHFQRCISAPQEKWVERADNSMVPVRKVFSDKYQWNVKDGVLLVVEVERNGRKKNIAAFAQWDMVLPFEK